MYYDENTTITPSDEWHVHSMKFSSPVLFNATLYDHDNKIGECVNAIGCTIYVDCHVTDKGSITAVIHTTRTIDDNSKYFLLNYDIMFTTCGHAPRPVRIAVILMLVVFFALFLFFVLVPLCFCLGSVYPYLNKICLRRNNDDQQELKPLLP